MSVYVDDCRNRLGRMLMCHMVADTLSELTEMADRLGIGSHMQARRSGRAAHYDICQARRRRAIRLGAKPVTRRELIRIARGEQ